MHDQSEHISRLEIAHKKYSDLGLLISPISSSINLMNYKEGNRLKSPILEGNEIIQFNKDFNHYDRFNEKISGLGAIIKSGTVYDENLVVIDIDGCSDKSLVEFICDKLKLPSNYEWIIKSGSHVGYHILVKCIDQKEIEETLLADLNFNSSASKDPKYGDPTIFCNGGTNSYYSKNEDNRFSKIEFKWNGFVVLPPSLHDTGNEYNFVHSFPSELPVIAQLCDLESLKNELCFIPSHSSEFCWPDERLIYTSLDRPLGDEDNVPISFRYKSEELICYTAARLYRLRKGFLNFDNQNYLLQITVFVCDTYHRNIMRRRTISLPVNIADLELVSSHFVVQNFEDAIKIEINAKIANHLIQPKEALRSLFELIKYTQGSNVYIENELAKGIFLHLKNIYPTDFGLFGLYKDWTKYDRSEFDFNYAEFGNFNTVQFLYDLFNRSPYHDQNRVFRDTGLW